MHRNQETISVKKPIILALILINVIVLKQVFISGSGWSLLILSSLPFLFFRNKGNSFSSSIFQKRKNFKRNKSLLYLSQLGTRYNLNFSSQEVLSNYIMGLDGVKRKLLILRGYGNKDFQICLVDLNLLESCSVKTYYGGIKVGELKRRHLNSYIRQISLQFIFSNGSQTLEVPFFLETEQVKEELPVMERKAFYWKSILSKMIVKPLREVG